MLSPGTYYSYDGHYFFSSIEDLIIDYKNYTIDHAVNKNNPYYNYYMYLSNHTRTNYSSVNIDEYIRNHLGFWTDVYGHKASDGTSRLYGMGTFFYNAQEVYGVNAILSLSLSRNETGNGRSSLAINKNNGFGLNAVDSNPYHAANWYTSFASSILGYANKWVTYGYAYPFDWRYFGPQFGDKWIGMNVKYASDTFWSEKMAQNYYNLDKAYGMQDYNYYQLGVVKGKTNAYAYPDIKSKLMYEYPEAEDGLVIVGEIKVGNELWYKVVSDLNFDSNYNEITSGAYNWNAYVYVKASNVRKINTGKNGYITPNEVTEYQDKYYTYDLYDSGNVYKPKVGISTKATNYYYDPVLSSQTGKVLFKDRYVMVYAAAIDNGKVVSYLVTSDYYYNQKQWVSASSIQITSLPYGVVTVDTDDNQYTWVNYNQEDAYYSKISGLYTYTYVPILDSVQNGSDLWYKVPVSLSSNDHIYGYTLSKYDDYIWIDVYQSEIVNKEPVINANNQSIMEGTTFNPLQGVTATDQEDGDITSKLVVKTNNVNTTKAGVYDVVYEVTDSSNATTTKTIQVTVTENKAPVINASDKTIVINSTFNALDGVTATDAEDGNITSKITVTECTVNTAKAGTYKVVYSVTDNNGKTTTKEIKVVVKEQQDINEEIDIEELLENQLEGDFYLNDLEWNNTTKKFNISGYHIILNVDNVNKEYILVLSNKTTEDIYTIPIDSWVNNTPFDLGDRYSNSWFKGELDLSSVPVGDYDLYLISSTDDYYTINIIDNYFNQDIDRRGEDSQHGYNFKVQQKSKAKEITLNIRQKLYTSSESPTTRNMVNGYEDIRFKNNKLYMYGYSYDYEGIYNNQVSVTRKLILENTTTFEQTVYDLGSVKGPFQIVTQDKKDKTYAWYEKEIDISNLVKGTYSFYIYTKTSNAEDYDELIDIFRSINDTASINNKTYSLRYNNDRNKRIELTIK